MGFVGGGKSGKQIRSYTVQAAVMIKNPQLKKKSYAEVCWYE